MKLVQNSFSAITWTVLATLLFVVFPALADNLSTYSFHDDSQQIREARAYNSYLDKANKHSLDYLEQARDFRTEGRYELARQRYLQALSICTDGETLNILKRELDGVELLLRTMR
ncbi:MAG: hypothetical protein J5861_07545 [Desulfovibrio sp.]|nr:hypothetical protein [Desulfovibrio sp.]